MLGDMKLKVKLGKGGNSLRITIPKEIIEALALQEGDTMELDVKDGVLVANKSQFSIKKEEQL
jgi:AbrB family looped-hinge helix DNA binding protein